jgi:alpha-D-xyloside xylohydrolase
MIDFKKICFSLCMFAWAPLGVHAGIVIHEQPTSGLKTEVTFYGASIVRVTKYVSDKAPEKHSFSVIAAPEGDYPLRDGRVSSTRLSVSCLPDGALVFTNIKGDTLLVETTSSWADAEHEVDRGKHRIGQGFSLKTDEAIYGLGQRQNLHLNQRGEDVRIWCGNTNITIPYFTSQYGYGLYWDNAGDSRFTEADNEVTFTSEVAPMIDYYFMYKDGTQDGVVEAIRHLTGEATMFPLWSMGHWQCRERYKSSDELCEVLDKYREQGIPLDGIVQDWQYWGCDSNWNAMRFMNPHYINRMGDKKWMKYLPNDEDPNAQYPDPRIKSPEEMVQYVHDHHAHLMISIWANFGPWTQQAKELSKIGALMPFETWPMHRGVHPYDPFNSQARDIYWKHLRNLYKMGFDAWWTDSTEPDHFEAPGDADYMTAAGSWRSVKNAFALMTNKGIYEHQRKEKGNRQRSLQMTRCGTFGLQHYGTFSWSGDVVSNWQVMKNQVPSGLNYVLCGIPYWNTDLGGFFGWDYNNDPKNPALQELQVRWMQWGCFMPLMRNHCSSPLVNELYRWGNPGDWAYDVQKKFIELRYRLLPYIYGLAGEVAHHSGTMMRPLVMDFPQDSIAIRRDDAYMFGHALLVKPVTDPLYTYVDEQRNGHAIHEDIPHMAAPVEVYLPAETTWYDFWTNRRYAGGRTIKYVTPIDKMPVFVKSGSIIPFGPQVQYSTEKPWDALEVRVYPGADATFTLYEDDGESYDYEQGAYATIRFIWDDAHRQLTIAPREGSFPGMLSQRSFRICIVNDKTESGDTAAQAVREVPYQGEEVTVSF